MIRFWLLLLLSLASCQCRDKNGDNFAVMFTTNLQGYVEPCGCTADPLGGIGRLATVINDINKAFDNRTVLIDAGNLLFDSTKLRTAADLCQDRARIDLLLSTLKSFNVIGTVPGPYDDSRGVPFRQEFFKRHEINDLMSRVSIIERGSVRIGVIGFSGDMKQFEKSCQQIQDADLKIVVAQTPLSITQQLRGVDIIIQGQDTGEKPLPIQTLSPGGPWIVSASMQGQYLGVLEFNGKKNWVLDDRLEKEESRRQILQQRIASLQKRPSTEFLNQRIKELKQELKNISNDTSKLNVANFVFKRIPIKRSIQPDSKIQAALDAYKKQIPSLVQSCEKDVECPVAKKDEATYVGAQTCKQCHQEAYQVWQNAVFTVDGKDEKGKAIKRRSGHAVAWKTLGQVDKTLDRSCVGCHSIGFMEPGGYCKASDVGFRGAVQCESCHGPGSLHAATGNKGLIKRQVPESTCRSCHHVPHIPTTESFVYEEKLQRILGEGHGNALLKKLKHL